VFSSAGGVKRSETVAIRALDACADSFLAEIANLLRKLSVKQNSPDSDDSSNQFPTILGNSVDSVDRLHIYRVGYASLRDPYGAK
jgi:hypothetical protein